MKIKRFNFQSDLNENDPIKIDALIAPLWLTTVSFINPLPLISGNIFETYEKKTTPGRQDSGPSSHVGPVFPFRLEFRLVTAAVSLQLVNIRLCSLLISELED